MSSYHLKFSKWKRLFLAIGSVGTIAFSSCATTGGKSSMEGAISYKTIDDGTLNVIINNQAWSSEQYTIESGSDGNWTITGSIKPLQANQNARDVIMELGQGLMPVSYTENAKGTTTLKVTIAFTPEKAIVKVKQGSAAETSKDLPGPYELFVGDGLFHHHALVARAFVAKNSTEPVNFKVIGYSKFLVKEMQNESFKQSGADIAVRHFVFEATGPTGPFVEHVWLTKSDLKLVKIEIGKVVSVVKQEFSEATSLTAVVAPKPSSTPPTPPTPATPSSSGTPPAPPTPATPPAPSSSGATPPTPPTTPVKK